MRFRLTAVCIVMIAIWQFPVFSQDDQADSSDEEQIQVPVPDEEGTDEAPAEDGTEQPAEEEPAAEEETAEDHAPVRNLVPPGRDTFEFGQFTFITNKDTTSGNVISIVPIHSNIWEDVGILQIGEDFYLSGKSKFALRYKIGTVGFLAGIYLPIRIPGTLIYYNARATFHKAVAEQGTMTLATATNELRGGFPLLIKNIPFEYIPCIGIGYNNTVIIYNDPKQGVRGWDTHYYWHYAIGFTVRQPIIFKHRYSSLGITTSYERSFVFKEQTDQRLVLAFLIGL